MTLGKLLLHSLVLVSLQDLILCDTFPGRTCGTEPLESDMVEMEVAFQSYLQKNGGYGSLPRQEIIIDTHWHVIHNGADGLLTQADVDASMTVLNQDLSNAGSTIQFNLVDTTFTDNSNWFGSGIGEVQALSEALRQGDCSTANIYSSDLNGGLLGFATLPSGTGNYCKGPYVEDGIRIKYSSVPGGALAPYNLGKTLSHEVGHWMGLYHTFHEEGECAGEGDYVSDTPAELNQGSGCPSPAPDSCPSQDGDDPINNYMDYTDDACMTEFTNGQVERMLAQYTAFRADGEGAITASENALSSAICFSSIATAFVKDKGKVAMKNLAVGDLVLTASGQFKTLYTMNHFHRTKPTNFLQIRTDLVDDEHESPLELSAMHLVYIEGKYNPVPAMDVQVGDYLQTLNYGPRKVKDIQLVRRDGLYNPITADGTMVVDGIISSSYTSFTGSAYLEVAGVKLISVHDLLDMTIAPYGVFCIATSSVMNVCNRHGEDELPLLGQFLHSFYNRFLKQSIPAQFVIISMYLIMFVLINILLNKYVICNLVVVGYLVFGRRYYNNKEHKLLH